MHSPLVARLLRCSVTSTPYALPALLAANPPSEAPGPLISRRSLSAQSLRTGLGNGGRGGLLRWCSRAADEEHRSARTGGAKARSGVGGGVAVLHRRARSVLFSKHVSKCHSFAHCYCW